MEYEFEYRDARGALRKGRLEAADRAACVAACRARGIAPVRVVEAHDPKRAAKRPRGGVGRALAGCGAMLALAAVAWLWLRPGTAPEGRAAPADVRQELKNRPAARPVGPRAAPADERSAQTRRTETAGRVASSEARAGLARIASVTTNDAGFVVTTVVDTDGRTNLVTETLRPQTFTDPMLQLIAAAIGGAYESELAPLPPVGPEGDAQLRAALKVEIPDLPGDTDDVRRLKEAVRGTREEMLGLLDSGVSVSEILTQHQELWNENVRIRREMKEEYRRTLASGDENAAADYLERVNGVFRGMGIPEISADEIRVKARKRKGTER